MPTEYRVRNKPEYIWRVTLYRLHDGEWETVAVRKCVTHSDAEYISEQLQMNERNSFTVILEVRNA